MILTCVLALSSSVLFIREHGFSFVRLDGTMSQKKRAQVIQEFQSSEADSPTIMLLSLKAGGVGLNLTAASHVFLMDPVSMGTKCTNSHFTTYFVSHVVHVKVSVCEYCTVCF